MWIWICLVTLAFYIYKKCKHHYEYWKDLNIPYVKCPMFLGNLAPFVWKKQNLPELVQDLYHSHPGRYVGIYVFDQAILLLKDLALIKQVCIKDFDHFTDRKPFVPEDLDPFLGKSLQNLSGQKWKDTRHIFSPVFTSSRIRTMFTLINDSAEQFVNDFMKEIEPNTTKTTELKNIYMRITNDMFAAIAFGFKCDSIKDPDNEFFKMAKATVTIDHLKMLKFIGSKIAMPVMKFFKIEMLETKASEFFRSIVKHSIAERIREGIVRVDVLSLLSEGRKGKLKPELSKKDEGVELSSMEESEVVNKDAANKLELKDDMLAAQILVFILGGLDTVSTVLGYACYELAVNMDAQEKLHEEVDTVLSDCEGKFTHEAISKMKYLDMVLSETMRKWPPGVSPDRVCTKPYVIPPEKPGEIPVPLRKGDGIWIPVFAIHWDPQYYPNPAKFDPERFSDENKGNIPACAYLPFGLGPRNCIGARLGLMKTKTVLVHLLSKFTFVVVEKTQVPIRPSDWQFFLQMHEGYWIGIQRRNVY